MLFFAYFKVQTYIQKNKNKSKSYKFSSFSSFTSSLKNKSLTYSISHLEALTLAKALRPSKSAQKWLSADVKAEGQEAWPWKPWKPH